LILALFFQKERSILQKERSIQKESAQEHSRALKSTQERSRALAIQDLVTVPIFVQLF
jgi:hypothetical protein